MSKINLNDHLDDMLERLMNEDITKEELEMETNRSKAVCNVASAIIQSQKVVLQAVKMVIKGDISAEKIPSSLEEIKLLNNTQKT